MSQIEVIPHPEKAPEGAVALWVDDCKPVPEGFAVARTYDDALQMCRRWRYSHLYLDHDLGESRTGLDLLRQLRREGKCPPVVECISWNPAGRKAIMAELAGRGSRGTG